MVPTEFEVMYENEDGWSDWVHPQPGYRMQCCDCGLVHDLEFAIVPANDTDAFHPGESKRGVIVMRARRDAKADDVWSNGHDRAG